MVIRAILHRLIEHMSEVTYEHPTEREVRLMTGIFNDSREGLPSQRALRPEEMKAMTFQDKDFDREGAWLAYSGGVAVGYADAFIENDRVSYGKKDAFLDLEVMKNSRSQGIEEGLVNRAFEYARGRGIRRVLAPFHESDSWRKRVLENAGFQHIRIYFEMLRRRAGTSAHSAFPEGVRVERVLLAESSDEVIARLAQIRNESFVDHYNYAPMPAERLVNILRSTDTVFSVTFAIVDGRTAGFVLSEDRPPREGETAEREGWVAVLGVVGPYRRRGLGRTLLLDSVKWLEDRGVMKIRLLVDAENEKALGMYRSAGFEVDSREILMSREL